MMMLAFMCGVFVPGLLGWGVIKNIFTNKRLPLFWETALGWGLGVGLIAQVMLLLGMAKIPYLPEIIGPVVLWPTAILLYLAMRRNAPRPVFRTFARPRPILWDGILFVLGAYVLFQVFFVFWEAFNLPLYSWDAIASNMFKAKVIFYERSLEYLPRTPRPTYPLHTELFQVWLAVMTGGWDEQLIKLPFPFYYLAFLVISFFFMKTLTSWRWGVVGVFLLTSAGFFTHHATMAYRDFPLMFYTCSTIILLLLWDRQKEDAWLWLAGLFAGMTTFVKSEGTLYAGIPLMLVAGLLFCRRDKSPRKRIGAFLKFFTPALALGLPYFLFRALWLAPQIVVTDKVDVNFNVAQVALQVSAETWHRIGVVAAALGKNFFLSGNWNVLWLVLIVSFLRARRLSRQTKLLAVSLFMYFFMFISGYIFTQYYFWIASSGVPLLSRQILHVFPLVVFLIVLLNAAQCSPKSSAE